MKTFSDNTLSKETHPLFPSGEWTGFYKYKGGFDNKRHVMSFVLNFQSSLVTGSGGDDVGPFNWEGQYDVKALKCKMVKYYFSHVVHYDGHADENGIWGTWKISDYCTGEFHIWPIPRLADAIEAEEKIELVAEKQLKTSMIS